jgi:hypothetical protein
MLACEKVGVFFYPFTKGEIMSAYKLRYIFLAFVICLSCAPQIEVVPLSKEAKERNAGNGIPYYLPKPYLLVTRNFEYIYTHEDVVPDNTGSTSHDSTTTTTTVKPNDPPTGDVFSYQIIYLPDTSEKYGIKISRGTGTFKGKISIENGWKFLGINLETDSKTAETIKGIGQAAKDIAPLLLTKKDFVLEGISFGEDEPGKKDDSDEEVSIDQKDIIKIFGDKLIKSLTQPDAEIYLYDISDLSKPILQWPTPKL